jgi:hypothetical protein
VNKKSKLEGNIWNCAHGSKRERLASHALIQLQEKDSSRAPFQGLDVSLAKKTWEELREDTQKQVRRLLRDATQTVKKESPDIQGVLDKSKPTPLESAVQTAVADAIITFALKGK